MNHSQLLAAAQEVLNKNWNGHFTKPAPNLYPHQWNWDSGFIAIGLAHFNMDRAEAELRHLFRGQWKNGMLPHIVFGEEKGANYFPGKDFWQTENASHSPENQPTSGITQPPVHGFVLEQIFEIAKDKERAKEFLKELFPKVLSFHKYLYENRDPHEEGLVYIQHPWEPGTDNSPTWDAPLSKIDPSKLDIPEYTRKDLQNPKAARHRPTNLDYDRYVHLVDIFRRNGYDDQAIFKECPFIIQDPLFNAILVRSNEALIRIGQIIKEDVSEIVLWNELTIYSMNEKLWDEEWGIYNAYDLKNDCVLPNETSNGLIPLFGSVPTQDQAEQMLNLFKHPAFSGDMTTETWLCPTYSLLAEDVDFEKYWRGPIWINMNWMLYHGLKRFDFENEASLIKEHTLELLSKYGFFEYFDPRKSIDSEAGYGTNQFSWSAALCIDLLKE